MPGTQSNLEVSDELTQCRKMELSFAAAAVHDGVLSVYIGRFLGNILKVAFVYSVPICSYQ